MRMSVSLNKMAYWVARALAGMVLISGFIAYGENRRVDKKVAPVYPELARRMHISGMVTIDATVSADGTVTQTKATSGNLLLSTAAEEAIHKWKFVPSDSPSQEVIQLNFAEAN